jgi:hypothetical protein
MDKSWLNEAASCAATMGIESDALLTLQGVGLMLDSWKTHLERCPPLFCFGFCPEQYPVEGEGRIHPLSPVDLP